MEGRSNIAKNIDIKELVMELTRIALFEGIDTINIEITEDKDKKNSTLNIYPVFEDKTKEEEQQSLQQPPLLEPEKIRETKINRSNNDIFYSL